MDTPRIHILERRHLTPVEVAEIKHLIAQATEVDGLAPLSEHVLIHLHHGGDEHSVHLLAVDDQTELLGYLHLDHTDTVAGAVIEVAVEPRHRGHHVATELVNHALALIPGIDCRLWAHGDNAGAHHLATSLGFHQSRELWQMRRSLLAPIAKGEDVAGVTIRTFVPGQDEAEWLALNNDVFTGHPEQGEWTDRDLSVRMSEAWFHPEGFLVAFDARQRMVGYTWTKIHGGQHHANHEHTEIGEIYVLGIHSSARGQGLAQLLTVRALEYLRSHGLRAAMLYVDANNDTAISLYQKQGFTHWDSDVMFTRPKTL